MKRLAFLVLGVLLFTNVKGQSLLDEGLFLKFEYCIQDFFEHEFSKTKDSLSILYGNYSYPYLQLNEMDENGYFSVRFFYPPSQYDNKRIPQRPWRFFRQPYDEYINNIRSHIANSDCPVIRFSGIEVFVNCPWESWLELYFDRILYKDSAYLTPSIEILQSINGKITHIRLLLVCEYTNSGNFTVKNKYVVRRSVICQ
jgi:hypothetical protein